MNTARNDNKDKGLESGAKGKYKLLLIQPGINPKTQRKCVSDVIHMSFPLSLGFLAGYLLQNGPFPLHIIDEHMTPINDDDVEGIVSLVERPRIFGITALTSTSSRAYQLARMIKRVDPSSAVVLGGVHPTVLSEDSLRKEGVDIVVRGEGEQTFAELVDCILNERDYRKILGISFKNGEKIIDNGERPLIKDLDTLPPFPYHLFEHNRDKYPGFASIQTSRGCPHACIFCSQRSISGRVYRYQSKERVLSTIRKLIESYHPDTIRIMDDEIGVNRKRLLELLHGIIDCGFNKQVSFTGPMRGDSFDEEVAAKIKEANFSQISFGLETASESLMKTIYKGETVEQVVKAIHLAGDYGIPTATTVIFGLPTETNADRWKAIKLVNSLPLDSARFNILTPYPGTQVFERLSKEGKIHIAEGWANFSVQYMWQGDDIPYIPAGTDRYELMFMTMFANLLFYLKPGGIWKVLTSRLAGGNVISLPKRWYLSTYFFRIARVALYLIRRFLFVAGMMLLFKIGSYLHLGGQQSVRSQTTPGEW